MYSGVMEGTSPKLADPLEEPLKQEPTDVESGHEANHQPHESPDDESKSADETPKGSLMSTIQLLASSGMGSGMLALPYAVRRIINGCDVSFAPALILSSLLASELQPESQPESSQNYSLNHSQNLSWHLITA